tara:strand:- start:545 stop:898 length:354 start_codon:yes stop_codon:yes gene_type:complete
MSREHFHESQIEDRVTELMEKGMSDEDAIQQAESEYDGQVNLVEDKALELHNKEKQLEFYLDQLKSGVYPSEIVLSKVIEYLQTKHENIHFGSREVAYAKNLLNKIDEWTLEVNNAS